MNLSRLALLGILVLAVASLAFAGDPAAIKGKLQKTLTKEFKFLDVNQINCTVASDGPYCDYRRTNSSGMEWPKGSRKTPVYTAGMWIAGKHKNSGLIRTAVQDYQTEYHEGPLLETFNTTTNDDALPVARASDPRYRLYKIQKNKPEGGGGLDPWTDWPVDLGAPYVDVNNNGVWDPDTDQPKFWGDQMMWAVINDVNRGYHKTTGTTEPMGIEIQQLFFAFNQPGALGNIMFMRWKIINKSDSDYDSVFIGMWSDVDMGDANDDLPGCDTTLSLGFVYNADNDDAGSSGYLNKPPALGFDFFQGPIVPGAPTDSALFEGKWVYGKRNLAASSFVVYTNGTFSQIVDPPLGGATFPRICYDYLLGKAGTIGTYIFRGTTLYNFFMSGDPLLPAVDGVNELPANFPLGPFTGQDVRIMINSGPFTLAVGDTQEVVGSIVVAQGADRLGSVRTLKLADGVAQQAFNDNFNVPSAPPLPVIRVSEMPNQIILDWSENSDVTESYNFRQNAFQGYNLYQGESTSGPWKKIATWDIIDSVDLIEDMVQDPVTGKYYLGAVQYGTNSGLVRHFVIEQDYLLGSPLVNGVPYYFSLTTYSYNLLGQDLAIELGVPVSLEAANDPITVVPHGTPVGSQIPTATGDVISHSRGKDDAFVPEVVDPKQLSGLSYEVKIASVVTTPIGKDSATAWNAYRTNANGSVDTMVTLNTNLAGDNASPLVDGVLLRLKNPKPGARQDNQQAPAGWDYNPSSSRWSVGKGTDAYDAGSKSVVYPIRGTAYGDLTSATGAGSGTKVRANAVKKVEIRFSNDPARQQKAYRWLNQVRSAPAITPPRDTSFIPWIKVRGNGFVYQRDYNSITVPFTAWEVDSMDGDPTPRQLNVGFLENNDSLYSSSGRYLGRGKIDGKWEPTYAANGGLEALYIFASTYADTENVRYNVNIKDRMDSTDIYYVVYVAKKDTNNKFFTEGDKLTITPNYMLESSRTFTYTAGPVPTTNDPALAKSQMGKINVVPNPYFAHNKGEVNVYNRFVTFTNLPPVARIRIFTLTGEMVRDIQHNDATSSTVSLEQWDLRNANGLPVASGIYIVHIEVPDAGNRILKFAIIQPEERPTRI